MNEKELINYYNKFNEDKRLKTKHGRVEYLTAIKYIEDYLEDNDNILDIGAGTGAYSIYFYDKGYDVTSVELVKHNLKVIENNRPNLKAYQGNAAHLSRFKDNSFDIIFLDPPYNQGIEENILEFFDNSNVLRKNGLIIVEADINTDFSYVEKYSLELVREKKYKTNKHLFFRKTL